MSEKEPEIKYQINEHLSIVGGKDAKEFIRKREEKDKKLLEECKSLSDHLDDLL